MLKTAYPPPVWHQNTGSPPVPGPGSDPFADWGTHLTPQQMIHSDDPFLRVAGQEILRRNAELGIVDPDGIA